MALIKQRLEAIDHFNSLAYYALRRMVIINEKIQVVPSIGTTIFTSAVKLLKTNQSVNLHFISLPFIFPFDAAHQIQDILREGIFSRVVSHDLRKKTPQLTPTLCVEHQLVVTLHTHYLPPQLTLRTLKGSLKPNIEPDKIQVKRNL